MIIIGVSGGLGNQMFQYALYEKFKYLGKEAKLDLSFYGTNQKLRKFELDLFSLDYMAAGKSESKKLGECSYGCWDKARRKLFGNRKSFYQEDLDKGYQPEILELENAYLSGYWQCEKYFSDIGDKIRDDFVFPADLSKEGTALEEEIKNTESVAVHIRRGDYLEEGNYKVYGNICTLEYYKKALSYIKRRCSHPRFFMFSNDIGWVRENLYERGMVLAGSSGNRPDYEDMYLMSICRHNIIANSSFSWWGAWLNRNANKMVISPGRWFNNHEAADAICGSWVTIDGKREGEL